MSKKIFTPPTQWDPQFATIMSAMQGLLPLSADDRNAVFDASATEELDYVVQRLSLTPNQAKILSAICFYIAVHPNSSCDMSDICEILQLHPLEAAALKPEIDGLEDRGYLYFSSHMGEGWRMEPKAIAALQSNRAFDVSELCYQNNMDFLSDAHHIIKEGWCNDSRNTILPVLNRMIKRNPNLPVVMGLNNLNCSKPDMWAMLVFMVTLAIEEDEYVNIRDIEQVLSRSDSHRFLRQLKSESHPFIKEGLIEPYGGNGMAQGGCWVLTRKGWETILRNQDDVQEIMAKEFSDNTITPYTSLTKKDLFFSGKTQNQVERLQQLLEDEQYHRIRQELLNKSMPTGFCCLFYGTPGTGKTECVQQLAITTGRDILQVNIATLRDKYVGESEKHLKAIFDHYRALVHKQKKAPILFFNEADAIFGNRMENTKRSVDKMENALQNIILQEMESLDGILICTTNLTSNLDKAFDRRFLYKVEFERPSNEARRHIWKSMLSNLTDEQAADLANRYDFSGGQILNISRKQIINAVFNGTANLDYNQINEDCKAEKLSRNNGQKIGF